MKFKFVTVAVAVTPPSKTDFSDLSVHVNEGWEIVCAARNYSVKLAAKGATGEQHFLTLLLQREDCPI